MEFITGTLEALDRDYWLWVAIFAVLYAFSLYIYFFPTPLSGEPFEPFRNMPQLIKNPVSN
jgi:hypothetical protein